MATKAGQDVGGEEVTAETRTFEPNPRTTGAARPLSGGAHIPRFLGPELYTKTCLYTMPPDRHFVIDSRPGHPQITVAVDGGHAFKFATLIGRILSQLALDGRTEYPIARVPGGPSGADRSDVPAGLPQRSGAESMILDASAGSIAASRDGETKEMYVNDADDTGRRLGLLERLATGPVICAEGYLFEFERRGYLQAGAYVPEVVLEHPDLVAQLHREFVHAGSDVVEAFTYYAHREKLRLIGKEHLLEAMNRQALAIAKDGCAGERRALCRQHLQHQRLRRRR